MKINFFCVSYVTSKSQIDRTFFLLFIFESIRERKILNNKQIDQRNPFLSFSVSFQDDVQRRITIDDRSIFEISRSSRTNSNAK